MRRTRPTLAVRTGAGRSPTGVVSVYDRMCWPDGALENALATGAHRRELLAWFGPSEYRRLAALSLQAARATQGAATAGGAQRAKVYLIPGLLGSQLGWPRQAGQPRDLLWLDPADIAAGRLMSLRWRRELGGLIALGAIPHTYLALRLRLTAAGYEVVTHDYDWRADISVAAADLARRLAQDASPRIVLIGHSMGGLLARAALGLCAPAVAASIECVIGLGTPHGGSIGAVQALRATYPVVLRLAALDRRHDAQTLGRRVFHSFVSLYQMLPHSLPDLDVFSASDWPLTGLRPAPRSLRVARDFLGALPPADPRFICIVGTGQRTVTGITRARGQFRYEITDAGDGTVPASRASLPGSRAYALACEHGELTRSARVAAALIDLIETGSTTRLREGVRARFGQRVLVSDAMLKAAFRHKLDWQRLDAAARRRYLNALNAPPPLYDAG
jgi:pimeloyl-ACP methyl ester carboxylesterase